MSFMSFDSNAYTCDSAGNMFGKRFDRPYLTMDGRTYDSTGAFFVGELERLDLTLHKPLVSISWSRDVKLRTDVTIADEVSSFTLSTFASQGALGTGNGIGNGKAWGGKTVTQVANVSVDIAKLTFPLRPWTLELKYDILELESAAKVGRPIDQQKFEALQMKHQMDIDEQVYYGDTGTGDTGLTNSSYVTPTNVVTGAGGAPSWSSKTPQEILNDVNTAIQTTWASAAWAVMPESIRIPPAQFSDISQRLVSAAGTMSVLAYLKQFNVRTASGNGPLDIQPLKWLIGAGQGGTIGTTGTVDRMLVYTNDEQRVRYPMTMLNRTPVQYDGLFHKTSYFCRLGVLEPVYPSTIGMYDGILSNTIDDDPVSQRFLAPDTMGDVGTLIRRKQAIA